MKRDLIMEQGIHKYYKVDLLAGVIGTTNINAELLLKFIGTHKRYGTRNEIGSAYVHIRQKVNDALNIPNCDRIRKTSKREVASIRKYYRYLLEQKNGSESYVLIPYKLSYIFGAIVELVEEIKATGVNIPYELQGLVNMTYAMAFYKNHKEAYYASLPLPLDKKAQCALIDDFDNPFSPLNKTFK